MAKIENWEACIHVLKSLGDRAVLVKEGCMHMQKKSGKNFAQKKNCETCSGMKPKGFITCQDRECQHNVNDICQLKEIAFDMEGRCLSCVSVTT